MVFQPSIFRGRAAKFPGCWMATRNPGDQPHQFRGRLVVESPLFTKFYTQQWSDLGTLNLTTNTHIFSWISHENLSKNTRHILCIYNIYIYKTITETHKENLQTINKTQARSQPWLHHWLLKQGPFWPTFSLTCVMRQPLKTWCSMNPLTLDKCTSNLGQMTV